MLVWFSVLAAFGLFRPDHLLFIGFVAVVLAVGGRWGRVLLIDWSPFLLYTLVYDLMRVVTGTLRAKTVHVAGPYHLEHALFGWLGGGQIPSFALRDWADAHMTSPLKIGIDSASAALYVFHFIAPLLTMWALWYVADNRRLMYEYSITVAVLNVFALVTYMALPVAPPWYVRLYGLAPPPLERVAGAAGGLADLDQMLGIRLFGHIWGDLNANQFAAVPSLHGAYPLLGALFMWAAFGKTRRGLLWLLYPAAVWFAAVYLDHHYLIDLLAGAFYSAVAWLITDRLLLPRLFDRRLDFTLKIRPLFRRPWW